MCQPPHQQTMSDNDRDDRPILPLIKTIFRRLTTFTKGFKTFDQDSKILVGTLININFGFWRGKKGQNRFFG